MEHFNKLTPAEAERLAFVLEEMGEVAQAAGKVLRHGYDSRYHYGPTNRTKLTEEIGDLVACIAILVTVDDIDEDAVLRASELKLKRLQSYQHHQPEELFS